MRRSIGRVGSALLNSLLPPARAQASTFGCLPGYCETGKACDPRCCKVCNGVKTCTPCNFGCPDACSNY